MFKRIFWLAVVVAAGWVIWLRLRQRQEQLAAYAPQFAPPYAAPPPAPPLPPVAVPPDESESSAEVATPPPDDAPPVPAVDDAQSEPAPELASADASEPAHEGGEDALPEPASTDASEPDNAPDADSQPEQPATTASEDASEPVDELGEVIGYCVRCKTKRTISDAHEETTESGRRAARGTCPVCGANMFTFLATNDDDEPADDEQA